MSFIEFLLIDFSGRYYDGYSRDNVYYLSLAILALT